ncbi:VOC family protein [Novosphingobium sp. G106]|uniref:VOC family protein n=1 Tax=Novosphingobium sp. G106 TaxID=2849500 RepID=UPI001C2D1060|nr:VOC family protein [Novosphingobium sp. G106]MBV1689511.1 VOC family protein [Novosphingobium sp. G106]
MIDYRKAFHTGVLVPDLDEAIAFYSSSLGITFATPFTLEALSVWTPEGGLRTVRNRFTFSVEGPLRLELQQGDAGSFFDPALSRGDHVGVWADDVAETVAAMTMNGWRVIAAGAAPEDGWGLFAYLTPEVGGMVVELASETLRPAFESWWRGGELLLG